MSVFEFENTFYALQSLKKQFQCRSCGIFAENPFTLGGCEHIFCNNCCDVQLEKNECPVCNMHVSVKDAQVNRQLFNLVKLCQRLENVLTDQDETPEEDDKEKDYTEICSMHRNNGCEKEICKGFSYSKNSPDGVPPKTCKNLSKKKSDQNEEENKSNTDKDCRRGTDQVNEAKTRKSRTDKDGTNGKSMSSKELDGPKTRKGRILKNSSNGKRISNIPSKQKTMTQMFSTNSDDEEEMESEEETESFVSTPKRCKTNKNSTLKASKKKIPPIDQTTMSQFFDYIDDSDDLDGIHDNMPEVTQVKMSTPTHSSYSRNKKEKSRNLRTRVKEMKMESAEESPHSTKSLSRRHSVGSVSYRIQELKDETRTRKTGRRSLSPKPSSGSKTRLNSSLTGSGKKISDPLTKKNAKGETLLHVAAIKGDIIRVEELLNAGATPNTRDNAGWTPLHEAVHHGFVDIARLLLDNGAMINVPGTENDTPLHDALRQRQIDCVRLLVSRGASTTSRNIHGLTPEDFALTEEMKIALSTKPESAVTPSIQELDALEYQQPCLLPTALSREQKITLQKCAIIIQGRVVEEFCPEVTHVITSVNKDGMCARTFKYMHGVVNGKWIVNFDWVNMCIEFGSKVCEEAFEVPGSSQNIESHAAEKGRKCRKNQLPKLFEGYEFYFHGNFEYPTPNKDDLVDLVKSGGGQILSREPNPEHMDNSLDIPIIPYHAPASGELSKCSVLVVCDHDIKFHSVGDGRIFYVSVNWLLDCIGTFKIQSC